MYSRTDVMFLLQCAYKKLKSCMYFDKTQLPLVDKIVLFEENMKKLDYKLEKLHDVLVNLSDNEWNTYVTELIDQIDFLIFPKRLKEPETNQVIFNTDNAPLQADKVQCFIDLPVEGHILGTLWVMTIGAYLDDRSGMGKPFMYEHSYGNRLYKNTNGKNEMMSFSNRLFEPYFSQYESWRDRALDCATKRLQNKQDALILTLDLRSFYYSVHISKKAYDGILENVSEYEPWHRRLHDFVYDVMKRYSELLEKKEFHLKMAIDGRTILPIGFLPSNILSNWLLTPFDEVICNQINPVYYGRYVDDIIIVDKIEKNSPMRRIHQNNGTGLSIDDVIEHYFCQGMDKTDKNTSNQFKPIFSLMEAENATFGHDKHASNPEKECKSSYRINPRIFSDTEPSSNIQIQNDKVKVFYFHEGASNALIDCFRSQIAKNASEFRFLPDMEHTLYDNDYSEIFHMDYSDTLNKLRGVNGVSLDRYALSKFLGKYRKVGRIIHDKKEIAFDNELLRIMDPHTLIENYSLWERMLEIMLINNNFRNYGKLAKNIVQAIDLCRMSDPMQQDLDILLKYKKTLIGTLYAAILRTSALCWGKQMHDTLHEILNDLRKRDYEFFNDLPKDTIVNHRKLYCTTCMINKYVLPMPSCFLTEKLFVEDSMNINLMQLWDFIKYSQFEEQNQLPTENLTYSTLTTKYLPYRVTPQDISFILVCRSIHCGAAINNPSNDLSQINRIYYDWNYHKIDQPLTLEGVYAKPLPQKSSSLNRFAVGVFSPISDGIDMPRKKNIKIAVGNARLNIENFRNALMCKPDRSLKRYQQLIEILNSAIKEKADMLVLPESYIPFDWMPELSRICANNQIAVVTGIEHVISKATDTDNPKVYNLTATILPYSIDNGKYAHVVYHHKVHYSPAEKREIEGYRMDAFEGTDYTLFCWNDLWFSVYCCFELASITDRSLFGSCADLVVGVEWNRDIPYFSNIIESLSRDLHCYCVQVNSTDYGDSRVLAPKKHEYQDIIKTKGGINYTILTDGIDIASLRDFQLKEYELQIEDARFKPTPPNFEHTIAEMKMRGCLWDELENFLP